MTYLYIDDERSPKTDKDWVVVRSFDEAKKYFSENPCPSYISFDHDLGIGLDGYDIAKMLVNKDLDEGKNYIPSDFKYNVHSANPVGEANIRLYLLTYLNLKEQEGKK